MFCGNCGKELNDTAKFCPDCGTPVEKQEGAQNLAATTIVESIPEPDPAMNIPIRNYDPRWDYTPLGAWSYFLYNLLFSIPLVGWIIALVFAVGGTNRINLRNYARCYFCVLLIAVVLAFIIIAIVFGVVGTEAFRYSSHYYM